MGRRAPQNQEDEAVETSPEAYLAETVPHIEFVPLAISEADAESHVPTIPQLCVAIGILALVLGSPYIFAFFNLKAPGAVSAAPTKQDHAVAIVPPKDYFEGVAIEADAAYVWDITTQRALFNKNAHAQLPLASLTKLMTALVAYDVYTADAVVPITLQAIGQEGENGFSDGDLWNIRKLVGYMLMTSSNDGAYAIAAAAGSTLEAQGMEPEQVFIKEMNKKANEIGLSQTYFTNPTGLDTSESQSGSYGSARDVAFLMEYIVKNKPELLTSTTKTVDVYKDESGTVYDAVNTNQTVNDISNILGSKTGYTLLAGGNLVIAFDAGLNHPIIISVLGSSQNGRFADVEALAVRAQKAVQDSL